ncbi:MAG: AI-2E family transporter [Candidatus Kryptoniota bacterium]
MTVSMQPIFKKNGVKVFSLVIFLLLLLWAVSQLGSVFIILLLSILMTYLLSPIIGLLETKGIKRLYGILIIYFLIFVIVAALLTTYLPPLFAQIVSIDAAIKSPDFGQRLQSIQSELQNKFLFVDFGNISGKVNLILSELADRWFSILTSAGSVFMVLIIIPFVTFFFLKDGGVIIRGLIEFVPNKYFEMTLNAVYKIGIQLERYIRAWLTEATIVGALSIVGLLLMGVKYAIIIGVAAGLANLIPYLGPIVGAVPAIIVTSIQAGNLGMVLPIVGLFVGIRIIDDLIIVPMVYSKGAEIHPLTIVLLILIAAEVGGILGMVLAMPLYTVFRVIAKETYWGLESYSIIESESRKKVVRNG